MSFTPHIVLTCALQFADFLRLCLSPQTTSRTISFLFPIVFSINLIPFFDICSIDYLLFFHPGCSCMCCITWAAARSQQLLFVVWQMVFGVSLRAATSNLPSSPNTLSNSSVLHDGRKHKIVVFSQSNAPREQAHRAILPLLAIGCRADCSGERRASPFSGIGRSLSQAVVIKTKSLPISATTFATALSLYIAQDGRKHKHNPTHSVKKTRTYLLLLAFGCHRWPCRRFR